MEPLENNTPTCRLGGVSRHQLFCVFCSNLEENVTKTLEHVKQFMNVTMKGSGVSCYGGGLKGSLNFLQRSKVQSYFLHHFSLALTSLMH